MNGPDRIGRFDQVRIKTTKNVKYLSAPPGTKISPQGIWSVVAVVADDELLLAKSNAIVRIPINDVLKVADYSLKDVLAPLGRLSRYEQRRETKGKKST